MPNANRLSNSEWKLVRPRTPLPQQVPIEGLQVPYVEDNAVPLRNRPLVKKLGPDMVEEPVGLRACLMKTCKQRLLDIACSRAASIVDLLTLKKHPSRVGRLRIQTMESRLLR